MFFFFFYLRVRVVQRCRQVPLTFAITLAGPWLPNKMGLCLNGGQMQIACDDKPVFFIIIILVFRCLFGGTLRIRRRHEKKKSLRLNFKCWFRTIHNIISYALYSNYANYIRYIYIHDVYSIKKYDKPLQIFKIIVDRKLNEEKYAKILNFRHYRLKANRSIRYTTIQNSLLHSSKRPTQLYRSVYYYVIWYISFVWLAPINFLFGVKIDYA